ncbi:MAG: hypothetical protein ACRD15_08095 [Vicinamibacterales bacterium]
MSIDQIVLSPATYLTSAPGTAKNDTTILPESGGGVSEPPPGGSDERVIYASEAAIVGPQWTVESDSTAAGGAALVSPNRGVGKIVIAHASPASYAELTFTAEAGRPYRLWLRSRAERNYWGNDSAHVQFSGTVDEAGGPVYTILPRSPEN